MLSEIIMEINKNATLSICSIFLLPYDTSYYDNLIFHWKSDIKCVKNYEISVHNIDLRPLNASSIRLSILCRLHFPINGGGVFGRSVAE